MAGETGTFDQTSPPLMTAVLVGYHLPARQGAVLTAALQRPLPSLPLQVTPVRPAAWCVEVRADFASSCGRTLSAARARTARVPDTHPPTVGPGRYGSLA